MKNFKSFFSGFFKPKCSCNVKIISLEDEKKCDKKDDKAKICCKNNAKNNENKNSKEK